MNEAYAISRQLVDAREHIAKGCRKGNLSRQVVGDAKESFLSHEARICIEPSQCSQLFLDLGNEGRIGNTRVAIVFDNEGRFFQADRIYVFTGQQASFPDAMR